MIILEILLKPLEVFLLISLLSLSLLAVWGAFHFVFLAGLKLHQKIMNHKDCNCFKGG